MIKYLKTLFSNDEKTRKAIDKVLKDVEEQKRIIKQIKTAYDDLTCYDSTHDNILNEFINKSNVMLWKKDVSGRYIIANKKHCEIIFEIDDNSVCLDFVVGKTDEEIFHELHGDSLDVFSKVSHISDNYVMEKQKQQYFISHSKLHGNDILVYVSKIPLIKNGKLIGITGIGWDVSTYKNEINAIVNDWEKNNNITTLYESDHIYCKTLNMKNGACKIFDSFYNFNILNENIMKEAQIA